MLLLLPQDIQNLCKCKTKSTYGTKADILFGDMTKYPVQGPNMAVYSNDVAR